MIIERKGKDSWCEWERVTKTYALGILKDSFKDLSLVIEDMQAGVEVETMFAFYRIKPDVPSDVKDLIAHLKDAGDEETAKRLEEFLAKGLIDNVDRTGVDHG
jgi:hypothetical protein